MVSLSDQPTDGIKTMNVSQTTIDQERRETANFNVDSFKGQPGRWISGCWYPAKARNWREDVKSRIIKETLLFPSGVQFDPIPNNRAIF